MIEEFTIYRSSWLRGEGLDKSRLLRTFDNKMCCLGSLGEACGIPREYLAGKFGPATPSLFLHFKKMFPVLLFYNEQYHSESIICNQIVEINDDNQINDSIREELLTVKFAEIGIKVHFKD